MYKMLPMAILAIVFDIIEGGIITFTSPSPDFTNFTDVRDVSSWFVWVKSCQDGVVGFFEFNNATVPDYDLVFGGDGNTMSMIRDWEGKRMNHTNDSEFMLDITVWKAYWMKWTVDSIVLGVGHRMDSGKTLSYSFPRSFHFRYIGVRTAYTTSCTMNMILELSCKREK